MFETCRLWILVVRSKSCKKWEVGRPRPQCRLPWLPRFLVCCHLFKADENASHHRNSTFVHVRFGWEACIPVLLTSSYASSQGPDLDFADIFQAFITIWNKIWKQLAVILRKFRCFKKKNSPTLILLVNTSKIKKKKKPIQRLLQNSVLCHSK